LSSHVIRSGGRIGCPIHQRKNSHHDAPNAHGFWSPTTMHTNANQQRNGTRATHQQNITKSTQSPGYALPLAKMLQCIGQFCYYWRPGAQNLADYFTRHHPTSNHKPVRPTILTPFNDPEYTKLFKTTITPVTFEQQIKTSVSTIFFVKNLLQTPRLKTMTINTVTAKSA
jgi:hypothetical protein